MLSMEEKRRMLERALRLEINTEGFYTELVKKTKDEDINNYLNQIVIETRDHAATLSRLIDKLKLE